MDLRAFRAKHDLTQEELGRVVGRSRGTVAAWESGSPMDLAAERLLAALDGPTPGDSYKIRRLAKFAAPEDRTGIDALRAFLRDAETGPKAHRVGDPGSERYLALTEVARAEVEVATINRIMAVEPDPSGGYLVGPQAVQDAILPNALAGDLAQVGVRFQPVSRGFSESHQPIFATIPAVQWLAEGEAVTADTPSVGKVSASFSSAGTGIEVSRRLLRLSGDQGIAAISRAITTALRRELDRAVLLGTGLLQPLGVLETPGVPTLTSDEPGEMIEAMEAQGIDQGRLGVVAGPALKRTLAAVAFDGRNLWRTTESGRQTFAGLPAMAIPGMPAGELLLGAFDEARVYHLDRVELRLRMASADGRHELFAFLDAAVEIPRPASFLRVTYA